MANVIGEVPGFGQAFDDMMDDIAKPPRIPLAVSRVSFLIRMPTAYHRIIRIRANKKGRSMNELVVGAIRHYIEGCEDHQVNG